MVYKINDLITLYGPLKIRAELTECYIHQILHVYMNAQADPVSDSKYNTYALIKYKLLISELIMQSSYMA